MLSTTTAQTTRRTDAPGSIGHGYSWVPPGLTRVKVFFEISFHFSENDDYKCAL